MNRPTPVRRSVVLLAILYVAVLCAGFIAPYAPNQQDRDAPFTAPTRVRFVDGDGAFHFRPFVYALVSKPGRFNEYEEDRSRRFPLNFLTTGARYTIAGIPAERHLVGVDEPARLFLFGTDQFGRDVFSRMCVGAQVSLVAGVLAAGLALVLGAAVGGLAGFYGGWTDDAAMRIAEIFMALPWLYLLLAVRSVLPLHIDPARAFLLLVTVIGLVGWARPARLVRGMVLSARHRDHVVAARAFGASDWYLLWRHVLPQTTGIVMTQLAVLIPRYVLAEVTLSFFGLGVSEPVPSWGNMLTAAQRLDVLTSYWWMLLPGIALGPVFLLYYSLANALHEHTAFLSP